MKKFWLGLTALMVSMTLFAERVSLDDAALVANHFMNAASANNAKKAAPAKKMVRKASAPEDLFYLYENENGEGWVIVSANDAMRPILAYSETGHFRTDNMPSNIKNWLGKYNTFTRRIEADGVEASEEAQNQWKALRKGARTATAAVVVGPLIQTTWDQDAPYWNLCPGSGNSKAYTGCVATAMAQVMKYWEWPVQGTGSHSYRPLDPNEPYQTDEDGNYVVDQYNQLIPNYSSYSQQTVNFANTTYDWDNMLNSYSGSATTAQKNAVATLMYHAGVGVEMMYGDANAGGSGAQTANYGIYETAEWPCAQNALHEFFGYKMDSIVSYIRAGYEENGYTYYDAWSDADWKAMLKAELNKNRPIMYAGAGPTIYDGGHSFICDGYRSDDYFHFNWGWSGSGDGYYLLDNLCPPKGGIGGGSYDFNYDQDVIIGIVPDRADLPPVTITWSVNGETSTTEVVPGKTAVPAVTPESCQNGKVFVGWTEQSNVSGTAPADLFTTGKVINEATTFYAVFATAEEGGSAPTNDYQKITSTTELENGNYIVVGYYNSNYFAMKNQLTSNGFYIDQQQVSPASSGMITTTDGNIIWQIALNNNTLSFYNVSEGKYVHIYKNGNYTNAGFTTSASDNIHFSYTVNNGSWDFVNTAITGKNHLEYYGSKSDFTAYTSAGDPIYLYKQQVGPSITYSDYTTVLNCGTTAIVNQVVAVKAVKVLENEQIVILRDNKKYSIIGQQIQ